MATWKIDPDNGAGTDFTSLAAADASGSTANGDIFEIQTAVHASDTSGVNLFKNVTVRAASAVAVTSPTAAQSTSKARVSTTNFSALRFLGSGNVTVEGIAVFYADSAIGIKSDIGGKITLRNVLIVCNGTSQFADNEGVIINSGDADLINVGFWGYAMSYGLVAGAGTVNVWQCSGLPNGTAFAVAAGTLNVYGCKAETGYGGGGSGGTALFANLGATLGGDYNESGDTTAPGTHNQHSATGEYTSGTNGSEDLTLLAANAFVDRSGFPASTDTDIAGTSRPSTGADPGAWQSASAPPAASGITGATMGQF